MVPVIVAVVMTLRVMAVAVIVLLAHGSGLLLAGQVHDGDAVPVNVSPDGDGLILG